MPYERRNICGKAPLNFCNGRYDILTPYTGQQAKEIIITI
jgi:hypothetical protein